ncbi:hypothetical protein [Tellurirhabdus rosea]|uniref:hypothetical protein n=1 Tax=Tellurirhabdus rosea TaxID=2674997 RepID=UPI00225A8406|nr:hypothetical protein [Tellurirhabdus rosea]
MKKLVYLLSLVLVMAGLSSCDKDSDPTPPPAIVGRWELNRGLLSGFAAPNQGLNGNAIDLYMLEGYGSRIDIFEDKTFNVNVRQTVVVDFQGTWEFANDKLTLTYDDGTDPEEYTYTKTGNIEELSSTVQNYALDSTTRGRIQVFYRK